MNHSPPRFVTARLLRMLRLICHQPGLAGRELDVPDDVAEELFGAVPGQFDYRLVADTFLQQPADNVWRFAIRRRLMATIWLGYARGWRMHPLAADEVLHSRDRVLNAPPTADVAEFARLAFATPATASRLRVQLGPRGPVVPLSLVAGFAHLSEQLSEVRATWRMCSERTAVARFRIVGYERPIRIVADFTAGIRLLEILNTSARSFWRPFAREEAL